MREYPIPVVRVILEDSEGRVLLLKRASEKYGKNQLCLPGGKVEYGQSLELACKTEVEQETGLSIDNIVFLFIQDNLPANPGAMHCINLYFRAKYTGVVQLNEESSESIWIFPSEISQYDIAFRNDEAIVQYLSDKNNKDKNLLQ